MSSVRFRSFHGIVYSLSLAGWLVLVMSRYVVPVLNSYQLTVMELNGEAIRAVRRNGRESGDQRCFRWNGTEDSDDWWAMHPDWESSTTNEDELCFQKMKNEEKAAFFRELHAIQYNESNCDNVFTKYMFSSGYGADMENVATGLAHAMVTGRPLQMTELTGDKWHYAAFKSHLRKNRKPVCPSGDMFCYFLPLGICPPAVLNLSNKSTAHIDADQYEYMDSNRAWFREYATRPQQWLRQRVLKYVSDATANIPKTNGCAAIHVRRSDIVLHQDFSRKYHPIEDYLRKLNETHRNIKDVWLFTDDANAIFEAREFHSEYNWMYLERKRFRGSEGGWENQLPSETPEEEFIALLSTFQIAQMCDVLVHTTSNFAKVMYDSMLSTGKSITDLNIDDGERVVFDQTHTNSEKELRDHLEIKRNPEAVHLLDVGSSSDT